MKSQLEEIAKITGHMFADPELLREALTHSSAISEKSDGQRDYQRLEFLGDRVLGLVISSYLVTNDPDMPEGELSLRLNALVKRETLAQASEKLQFDQFVIVGPSEKDIKGRGRTSILADIFESVLGAIYLDGGLEPAGKFVEAALGELIAAVDLVKKDPKSRLQEYLQGQARGLPSYDIVAQEGPPHAPEFTIKVETEDSLSALGKGTSRREAERQAALAMLKEFGE